MGLENKQLVEAAAFTNEKYPNLELEYDVEDKDAITAGDPAYINITVKRESNEDDEEGETEVDTEVHAPFYPNKKQENWWLVVAEEATRSLLAVKRVTILNELKSRLEFVVPEMGKKKLTLFLMCDSYVGVDQSVGFEVDVGEGMEEDEDGE